MLPDRVLARHAFGLIDSHVFNCPRSHYGHGSLKSCSFSFPPFCILHRKKISEIEHCEDGTHRVLQDYATNLRLLEWEELLFELKTCIALELGCSKPNCPNAGCYHGDAEVVMTEVEKRPEEAAMPQELKDALEKLRKVRKDRLAARVNKAKDSRTEKENSGSGKDECDV